MSPKPVTPVSEAGLRELYADQDFLDSIAASCALEDLYEPFDDSDAWWWLCMKMPTMKAYGRTNLRRTAQNWISRVSAKEVYEARVLGAAGRFDHLIPDGGGTSADRSGATPDSGDGGGSTTARVRGTSD